MVYFLLWKSENAPRARLYDCKICVESGQIERRACYKYDTVLEHDIPFVDDGRIVREKKPEHLELDRAEFIEVFSNLVEDVGAESEPVFKMLMRLFPKVCPLGLVCHEQELNHMANMESTCLKYHQPPTVGAVEDWPNRLYQMFQNMSEARNDFEMARIEEMSKKQNVPATGGI